MQRVAAPCSAGLSQSYIGSRRLQRPSLAAVCLPCRVIHRSAAFRHVLHRHATPCPLPRTLSNARRVEHCLAVPRRAKPSLAKPSLANFRAPEDARRVCLAKPRQAQPRMAQADCRTRERMRCVCCASPCNAMLRHALPVIARLPRTVARVRCVWQASHSLASHSNRPAVLRKPRTFRTSDATRRVPRACPPFLAPLPATSWRRCCRHIQS